MDPAGPGFTWPTVESTDKRLDRSDAKYVQCVHTARLVLGTMIDCGHGDFIFNSGFMQPGCNYDGICSHSKAIIYFKDSFDPSHEFISTKCDKFSRILHHMFNKECTNETDRFGIHSARKSGRFHIKTKKNSIWNGIFGSKAT